MTPSGLSASVISTKDIISNNSLYEGIVLDYSIKYKITDIETTIQRLDALVALSELFFGETSYLSKGLDELVYKCKRNKILLKQKLCLDEMFIPKLLHAVDDRVNQWLFQCCQEESVRETTLELVRFSDLIIKLQLNEFICHLPVNIRRIAKDESSPKKRKTNQENQKTTKNQKQEIVSMVRNENVKEEWRLKEDESWNKMFRHKVERSTNVEYEL